MSDLELTLGEVSEAVGDAEKSVAYADRSGHAFQQMVNHCTYANALHQAERRTEAESHFHEAEKMQAKDQAEYPMLYSCQGFVYCDLLLAATERAAWRTLLASSPFECVGWGEGVKICYDVEKRAAQALQIVLNGSRNLLDIGSNHLTLGRTMLYQTILVKSEIRNRESRGWPPPRW